MRLFFRLTAVTVLLCAGCKARPEARYVLRAPDMGVIAMPEDTPENRGRAIALMHSHFPDGYEIVWEGEEAVLAPLSTAVHDPMRMHHRRMIDPIAAAAWNEPAFQHEVESMPGTPQSMRGYAGPPVPAIGVHVGDLPPQPVGTVRSEWRITYRKKSATSDDAAPQSLFADEGTTGEEDSAVR